MNFQFYIDKLKNSKEFKDFLKAKPKAYLCSGFFTIDKEGKDNQQHIDFFSSKEKKVFSFKFEHGENEGKIEKLQMDFVSNKIPEPLSENVDFDFEIVEKLILNSMEKNKIKNKLQKIIISLQKFRGKDILVCTVFISMLGLLKIHIDLEKNSVIVFEKKSLFDLVRKG